jgi:hypothetical protein
MNWGDPIPAGNVDPAWAAVRIIFGRFTEVSLCLIHVTMKMKHAAFSIYIIISLYIDLNFAFIIVELWKLLL